MSSLSSLEPAFLHCGVHPLHATALISLSLAKMRLLLTLTLYSLTIWCSGQTARFLFLLAKAALTYLPTALSVALRPLFPFQQAQYAQVFLLKPAPFCMLLAGLSSINKSATSLLLSDSHFVPTTLSSPPSFLLPQPLWQELSSLSSCSIRLQWVPRHSFLPRNDAADELARQGALLVPTAIPCSLSSLISHIHSSLFLDWRYTVPSKFFDTQVSSISTEELMLPRDTCCVLSCPCCNGHSLLLSSLLELNRYIGQPIYIGRYQYQADMSYWLSTTDKYRLTIACFIRATVSY